MNYASQRAISTGASVSDALWGTYRWMTLGLGITGIVAFVTASTPEVLQVVLGNKIVFWGLLIAQLGLVFAFSGLATRVSTAAAAAMFLAYAGLTGLTMSTIFLVYTASSIAKVFFITAGSFGGLSVFGLVTKADLSGIGRFAIFALIGIIIASVVNIFLRSTGLDWILSIGGVLVFGALTAYDTQKLKDMFASGEVHANLPLVGALTLYLDFINMFLFLLRLFGGRRSD
jgi:uncharacterized protein